MSNHLNIRVRTSTRQNSGTSEEVQRTLTLTLDSDLSPACQDKNTQLINIP